LPSGIAKKKGRSTKGRKKKKESDEEGGWTDDAVQEPFYKIINLREGKVPPIEENRYRTQQAKTGAEYN